MRAAEQRLTNRSVRASRGRDKGGENGLVGRGGAVLSIDAVIGS